MKMQIDSVIRIGKPQASHADVAIVQPPPGHPRAVLVTFVDDGRTVRVELTGDEARGLGEMIMVCGAVSLGGMPPVVAPPETNRSGLVLGGNGTIGGKH